MATKYVVKYGKGRLDTSTYHVPLYNDVTTGREDPWWVKTLCGKTLRGKRGEFGHGYSAFNQIITCKTCIRRMGLTAP